MLRDEDAQKLRGLFVEYKTINEAPGYEALIEGVRGRSELMSDEDAAFLAVQNEWAARYTTVNNAREVWAIANPALLTLQFLVDPAKPIRRQFPKLLMNKGEFERATPRRDVVSAGNSNDAAAMTWEGMI